MHIGIVGCGTAGPAAAVMLARQGHPVTVFDKAPALTPVGAGLLLQPSGLAVLDQLGLRDRVERAGSLVRRMHATLPGPSRRTVLDLSYADLRPDLYGVGIRRSELLSALLDAAVDAGATIKTGVEVTAIRDRAEKSELVSSGHETLGAFDVVLLCDGARSNLVGSLGIPTRVHTYQWGALWFIGKRAAVPQAPHACTLEQVYQSTTELVGTLPSGTLAGGEEAVSLFCSERTDRFEQVRRDLPAWRSRIAALHPRAGEIASQVLTPEQLLTAAYREVVMPRWHKGRTVILGDAAHALSPLLGMGANMGLVDAHTLAASLAAYGPAHGPAAYSAARRASITAYQRICRAMNPFFQGDTPWLGAVRDALVPRLCKWRWSRRQALLSIAGVKTGLLAAGPLPPARGPRTVPAPPGSAEPTFAASAAAADRQLTDQR